MVRRTKRLNRRLGIFPKIPPQPPINFKINRYFSEIAYFRRIFSKKRAGNRPVEQGGDSGGDWVRTGWRIATPLPRGRLSACSTSRNSLLPDREN